MIVQDGVKPPCDFMCGGISVINYRYMGVSDLCSFSRALSVGGVGFFGG